MLVELHSITSHAPANLNRDDLGRPKSAYFGGVQRARISSQAVKRSIRTSHHLSGLLAGGLSTRSRQIPKEIHKALIAEGLDAERVKKVCEAFIDVLGKPDKKNELCTSQIVFLTAGEMNRATEYLRGIVVSSSKLAAADLKDIRENGARAIGLDRVPNDAADMALFGRMTTDDAEAFAAVDAAMQVAHAISTHTVVPEVDWFTAVDDIATGASETGSAHLGETEFNSAVFYKYFSCNFPLLVRNMGGDLDAAGRSLAAFFDVACRVTPSGKQNSFASHPLADTVLIVVRDQRIPLSLANAFERPVDTYPESGQGYLAISRTCMVDHYTEQVNGFKLPDRSILFHAGKAERERLAGGLPTDSTSTASLDGAIEWTRERLAEFQGGAA